MYKRLDIANYDIVGKEIKGYNRQTYIAILGLLSRPIYKYILIMCMSFCTFRVSLNKMIIVLYAKLFLTNATAQRVCQVVVFISQA